MKFPGQLFINGKSRASSDGKTLPVINPANSTQTSEEGNNDTSALDKDIITIVHAEYELE